MAHIDSVNADMDYRAFLLTRLPPRAGSVHHQRVADADRPSVHDGSDSLARDLLYIHDRASVRLVGVSMLQRDGDRV